MDKSAVAVMNETILNDIKRAGAAVRDFGRLVFAEDVGYANLPRTCTVSRVVSPKYTVGVEELRDGSTDVREALRSAVHDVAMETRRRGTGDELVTYPDIHMRVEAGVLETFVEVFIVTPNAPVSGGTPSAPVGCSADFCETRIAVESAMKHRGQWDDTPRRPYPQNSVIERSSPEA